jgi:cob(II)yrinic acid a,c-diamide reductase
LTESNAVDAHVYRNAMAQYAGHVQLITTEHDGVRRGVTITAACSVSDNPPTVLACLNSGNEKNAIFLKSGKFALNSLGLRHRNLSDAFAGFGGLSDDDRFTLAKWSTLATGAPVLDDALVSFDCNIVDVKPMSTHLILLGQVEAIHFGKPGEPLLYFNRNYLGS